jgi:hypothetical protein
MIMEDGREVLFDDREVEKMGFDYPFKIKKIQISSIFGQ